jgi:surface polysaccharide O-acyltransferase-like enzyme
MLKPHAMLEEPYLYRAVAILAVLIIHSTSYPVMMLQPESSLFILYIFLNIFSKFAVPAFFFLNGFILFYNYYSRPMTLKKVLPFYRNRLVPLVIPYLLFSFFYHGIVVWIEKGGFTGWGSFLEAYWLEGFVWDLLFGKAYAHLYFVIVMLQWLVLFPWILMAVQRFQLVSRNVFFLGLLVQWIFVWFNHEWLHWVYKGSLVISYASFLGLGAWIGLQYEDFYHRWVKKPQLLLGLWTVWGISSLLHIVLWYMTYSQKSSIFSSLGYEWIWNIHSLSSCMALLFFCRWARDRWSRGWLRLGYGMGAQSFGIFLIHPFFLLVFRRYTPTDSALEYHLWNGLAFAGTFVLTLLIVKSLQRYCRYYPLLIGVIPTNPLPKSDTTFSNAQDPARNTM